jgi:hypothetical protein
MIEPEDTASWPTLDFVADKIANDETTKNQTDLNMAMSSPAAPQTARVTTFPPKTTQSATITSLPTSTQSVKTSPSSRPNRAAPTSFMNNYSTSSIGASFSSDAKESPLNDIAPKPTHSGLNVEVKSTKDSKDKSLISKGSKFSISSDTKGGPTWSSISPNSSKKTPRTSSISHAEWCKQHTPRRSTLKVFQSASEVQNKRGIAFIPGAYEGLRKGYLHRSGVLGTGYYLETDEVRSVRQEESGVSHKPELHPSLRGMGLNLNSGRGSPLNSLFENSAGSEISTHQSRVELYERVLETNEAVHTLSPEYRKQNGNHIWGPEDADWLTRRLAEQYKQERIGHCETLAANVHQAPTTRGDNFFWNTKDAKAQNNVSYYERLHETMFSGSNSEDGGIAGSWQEVLKKGHKIFLPQSDSDTDTDSSYAGSQFQKAAPKVRGMGFESDWLRTPTHGVTGKREFKVKNQQKQQYSIPRHKHNRIVGQNNSKNNMNLHRALKLDTSSKKFGANYITHKTGLARACKGSNSVWNTQEPKSSPKKVNRHMRNPKPDRLISGLNRNRKIQVEFTERLKKNDGNRQSPQQSRMF